MCYIIKLVKNLIQKIENPKSYFGGTFQMRKLEVRVLALLLCVCMIAPLQIAVVSGVEINKEEEIGGNIGTPLSDNSLLVNEPPVLSPEASTLPISGVHGSGSYQLNEVGSDYRFYTEYFVEADTNKSISSAGVNRRTAIKVYANAGEVILFGSSVANSQIDESNHRTGGLTGKDIVITTPGGAKVCEDVLLPGETDSDSNLRPYGLGYIQNPTQEKNGPMVNHDDEAHPEEYYVPLQYEVTASGVYTFEFHSVTGFNPNSASSGYHPSPKKASENWAQGNTAVAAWDITVLGKNAASEWEIKSGRAWADYLALTTGGGEGIQSDLNVHVLSHDGYQYKVDFKEAVPYGFIFFANNTGFMSAVTDEDSHTTTYRPIYHSFYDSSNDLDYISNEKVYLHKPNEADTDTQETYKIFFNAPNSDLNGVSFIDEYGVTENIKTAPSDAVEITGLSFSSGGYENVARAGHGGYFSFNASDEATITIRLDLREAIFESEGSMQDAYGGSGIVEITAPVIAGANNIYWDGKDTDGIVIPAGIYGDSNVVLATEVKRGELHFPVIDMEGLYGGLTVQRINGADLGSSECFNLYYNNSPLAYGTIEGKGYDKKVDGAYYALTDGTKSYKAYTDRSATLSKFFIDGSDSISTLKKDDKDYLAHKMFNSSYDALPGAYKAIIDAEFGNEQDTFHFEPVNSSTTTMKFRCEKYDGGGNQAGIDAWTYYTQGINSQLISFAILDAKERGIVKGQIFYDSNISSSYDAGDYYLPGVKVRLIDSQGNPVVHKENLPCFDETGHFIYDVNGKIKHEEKFVKFEAETDSTGTYRFTGVPYSSTENTTYYVQVLLSDVQSEVMRYTCTTSEDAKAKLKTSGGVAFINPSNVIAGDCGADGNTLSPTDDTSKIYRHIYNRDVNNETIFDAGNAQTVTFLSSESGLDSILVKEFKKIGLSSTVPAANQKDYKIVKNWGTDSHGDPTHKISDGLTVELWVWNDEHVKENHTLELSRRTGALVDTQVLDEENHWNYTWKNLDDRLQYYVLEYYTKKKQNGEVVYNDRGEARKVLIGGTMPVFGAESSIPAKGIYGFKTNMGDYPETIADPDDSTKTRIPIQKFGENGGKIHTNSITKKEKLESVDNNARQYNVTYTLSESVIDGRDTNIFDITNSQVYDDRAYYVWLDHQTKLPDLIAQTYVEGHERKSHALKLVKDTNRPLENGAYCIKGLSVSSVDAAQVNNAEGNATTAFRIMEDGNQYAFFTATNHGNYKTGIGTRTYQVKYVVDASTKEPVSVTADGNGALVLTNNPAVKVEGASEYIVYSWYMTIHVYDVAPDGIMEYNPKDGPIVLQEALAAGEEIKWTMTHDGTNDNLISYVSNDKRSNGILKNDTYRVPLYKAAENPDMGSCADIVGIAYAGDKTVADPSLLTFADTYESRYGSSKNKTGKDENDGKAVVYGNSGSVEVDLNTLRNTRINRTQDHLNYARVTFTPNKQNIASEEVSAESVNDVDVYYYKVVVFAEDNTYQYHDYSDIDASEGVTMYTYFAMKPKSNQVDTSNTEVTDTDNANTSGIKLGNTTPKTGDDNDLLLWLCVLVLAVAIIAFGISRGKMPKAATGAICVIGLVILGYAGYQFVTQFSDYKKSSDLYENAAKEYAPLKNDEDTDQTNWKDLVNVNISKLREENADIVGWIYFENEDISYPVLHSGDNSTYLRKAYTGETMSAGSIFMEGRNDSDFSDVHTIIYGHNMKDLSMFGKLKNYVKDAKYITDHEYFQIVTESEKYRYKIVAYKVVAPDSDIYTIYKDGGQDFLSFVKEDIRKGSYLDFNENVTDQDHLISLSTCSNDDRLVVTALRCDECIVNN